MADELQGLPSGRGPGAGIGRQGQDEPVLPDIVERDAQAPRILTTPEEREAKLAVLRGIAAVHIGRHNPEGRGGGRKKPPEGFLAREERYDYSDHADISLGFEWDAGEGRWNTRCALTTKAGSPATTIWCTSVSDEAALVDAMEVACLAEFGLKYPDEAAPPRPGGRGRNEGRNEGGSDGRSRGRRGRREGSTGSRKEGRRQREGARRRRGRRPEELRA